MINIYQLDMDYIRAAISIKSSSVPSLSCGRPEWPQRVRFSQILDNSGVALSCISRRPGYRLLLKAMANSIAGQLESLEPWETIARRALKQLPIQQIT